MIDLSCLFGSCESHLVECEPGCKLIPDVFDAIRELQNSAKAQGFDLRIASAHRSFERQRRIWNSKATGMLPVFDDKGLALQIDTLTPEARVMAILRWSALPGASRHHWGTDFDVYDAAALKPGEVLKLNVAETEPGGPFFPMYVWLDRYLKKSDLFFRPYERDLGGVAREPWHLSYTPLSCKCLEKIDKVALKAFIVEQDIALRSVVLEIFDDIYERFIVNISKPANKAV